MTVQTTTSKIINKRREKFSRAKASKGKITIKSDSMFMLHIINFLEIIKCK